MTNEQKQALVHGLTRYDRSQVNKRGYNPYALGHYLRAVDRVEEYMAAGHGLRDAIEGTFNDRILTVALKSVGLA